MDFPDDLRVYRSSGFLHHGLPEGQREIGGSLSDNYTSLGLHAEEIVAAVLLFEMTRADSLRGDLSRAWRFMAARDCAMAIRNFGKALSALRASLALVPEWAGKVDKGTLKEVSKKFDKNWPDSDKMRHSIAHPEFYSNPSKSMSSESIFPISGGGIYEIRGGSISDDSMILKSAIHNDTYMATIDGQLVKCDVDRTTAGQIIMIHNQVADACASIDPSRGGFQPGLR